MDSVYKDGVSQPIVTGQIQNPPKTFTYTIANQGIATIYYDFRFLRILSITNATGVTLRFGMTGQETDVIGAGIGYELEIPVRNAQIRNNSGGSITVVVSVSMGRIYDDRLNVSGSVTVTNTIATPLYVTDVAASNPSTADVNIAATTKTLVKAAGTRKGIIISNLLANSTVVRVGDTNIGAARGVEIPIGGSITLDTTADVYIYNPSAGAINIGVVELI